MLKEILTSPTEELGRFGKFVWFQLKLWPHCARLLKVKHSGQQAAALSYHTVFGIVPLAIIILMIFQLFPGYSETGRDAKEALYDYFNLSRIEYPVGDEGNETIKLTEKIDEITGKFMANLNKKKGAITFFSLAIVMWAAIGLLMTIERAFNGIWHVTKGRNILQRLVNYWTLLTLGPLLLILGFYFSTSSLIENGLNDGVMSVLRLLAPYLITVMALFFLYFLMPNTKVNPKAAIWGASVAALVWTGAKYLFAFYVIEFIPGQKIYGVMGIIPLSVFWIFVTWMIVLFGLYLTYTTQNLKTLDAAEIKKLKKEDEFFVVTDFTVIRIMAYALEVFGGKKGVLTMEMISKRLDIPVDLCGMITDHLVSEGLLLSVTEPQAGVVLAGDANNITLGDISKAALHAGFAQKNEDMPEKLKGLMDKRINELRQYSLGEIVGADSDK